MPKAKKTLLRTNQKNQLIHSDYLKQLKQLKDKYRRLFDIKDEYWCVCWCICCCECDETARMARKKKAIEQAESAIENLKCGCGCT